VTEATPDAGDEQLAATARGTSISPNQAALSGFRQPVVAVLLLIALCTAISGKPLDGVFMLTVAMLLAFDAARTRLGGPIPASPASTAHPARPARVADPADSVSPAQPARASWRPRLASRRAVGGLALVVAAALYAGFVGAFSRYSWPATIAVVAVGCLVVAIGWPGPLRLRPGLTGTARHRSWLWAVIVIVGGLWELSSLLQQPHLTTDSYAHPTISALTDPLLASHPGRSVALGAWLLIGWFLAGR
jgi:hypothetical protein